MTGTTDNGIITLDGTAPNGKVEENLTFDGNTLSITGNLKLQNGSQQSGRILFSDSEGLSSWGTYSYGAYSAGVISESGSISTGSGTITIPSVKAALYNNSNFIEPLLVYDVAGGTSGTEFSALVDQDTNYVYIDYNSGSPTFVISTSDGAVNESSVIRYLTLFRAGNFIHVLEYGKAGAGLSNKINQRFENAQRFARESGLVLGLSASTGIVTLTEGVTWNASNRKTITAVNSADNVFFKNYHSGGSWTYSTAGDYMNDTYYDDGSNIVSASASKYIVNWYYRGQETGGHLYELYGNSQYENVSEAKLSTEPQTPEMISSHAFLVGRIITQAGTYSGIVENIASSVFQTTQVASHNDLNNMQGGAPGEYYHLDANKHDHIALTNDSNDFTVAQNINASASISNDLKISGNTIGSNNQGIDTNALIQSALLFLSNNC